MADTAIYPVIISKRDEFFDVGLSVDEIVPVNIDTSIQIIHTAPYEGEYIFTPSDQTIVIPTDGKTLYDDITINPIPSNYGLITWNGAALTVS